MRQTEPARVAEPGAETGVQLGAGDSKQRAPQSRSSCLDSEELSPKTCAVLPLTHSVYSVAAHGAGPCGGGETSLSFARSVCTVCG